jgi:hypothetical protein
MPEHSVIVGTLRLFPTSQPPGCSTLAWPPKRRCGRLSGRVFLRILYTRLLVLGPWSRAARLWVAPRICRPVCRQLPRGFVNASWLSGPEIASELTGHGLPLSKCEAYNRVYEQPYESH